MDIINLFSFICVATLLVMSPGPNGVLIIKTVAIAGPTAGFANVWGFVAAFYIHGTLSIFGLSLLIVQSAQAFMLVKFLGAIYLGWLGVKMLMAAWQKTRPKTGVQFTDEQQTITVGRGFIQGFLTNVFNPKVSMFYLAAFPQFLTFGESAGHAYILVTAHALVNLVWFSGWVILLTRIKRFSIRLKFSNTLNYLAGFAFIAFATKLLLLKPLHSSE